MAVIIFCLVLFAIWYCVRVLPRTVQHARTMGWRDEEIERTRKVLEFDPTNSGSRAKLAGFLIEDGELEAGIDEYRTAIRNSPSGPFTTEWKRKLKAALVQQEEVASGKEPVGFNEWRVCGECQMNVSVKESKCPRCGVTLNKGIVEWGSDKRVQNEIIREAVPVTLVLGTIILVFTHVSLEMKGFFIIVAAVAGGWFILKSFDR